MKATKADLRILTNRGGDRVFLDQQQVRDFTEATSEDLATLTAIIENSDVDDSFISHALGLLNDLAFQLQQSVKLICTTNDEHSATEVPGA